MPYIVVGQNIKAGVNLGTLVGFNTIAATVCDYLGVPTDSLGISVMKEIQL